MALKFDLLRLRGNGTNHTHPANALAIGKLKLPEGTRGHFVLTEAGQIGLINSLRLPMQVRDSHLVLEGLAGRCLSVDLYGHDGAEQRRFYAQTSQSLSVPLASLPKNGSLHIGVTTANGGASLNELRPTYGQDLPQFVFYSSSKLNVATVEGQTSVEMAKRTSWLG